MDYVSRLFMPSTQSQNTENTLSETGSNFFDVKSIYLFTLSIQGMVLVNPYVVAIRNYYAVKLLIRCNYIK